MSRTFLKLNLTASGKVKIPPSRLAPMTREAMDEAHKAVYDSIVNSARGVKPKKDGSLGGPFNSYAYASPEIAKAVDNLGNAIRYSATNVSDDLQELAISMVGAQFKADFEWWAHCRLAIKNGVPADAMEAIRIGKTPDFGNSQQGKRQQAVYEFVNTYFAKSRVSDELYAKTREAVGGDSGIVELTMSMGYYCNVCALLNIFVINPPKKFFVEE